MRILIVNSLYSPEVFGGAEISVQYLAEYLAAAGEDVAVASLTPRDLPEDIEEGGVTLFKRPLQNVYWPFQREEKARGILTRMRWHVRDVYNAHGARMIRDIIEEWKPDIIHTNNLSGWSISAWLAASSYEDVRIVHTIRDYYHMCVRVTMFQNGENCSSTCLECLPFAFARRIASQRVHAVVGNSQFILRRHLDAGYFQNAEIQDVIFSGYRRPSLGKNLSNSASSWSGDRVIIGYLGRLHETKGIAMVVDCLRNMKGLDYALWIGGEGSDAFVNRLRELADSENASLLGYVETEHFMNQIDMLIVPSLWHDPLPRTIVEAFSLRVPVVASNRGGIPEVVSHRQTGLLFNPDVPDSLRDAIEVLANDASLRERIVNNASACAHQFDAEYSASRYRSLYSQMT